MRAVGSTSLTTMWVAGHVGNDAGYAFVDVPRLPFRLHARWIVLDVGADAPGGSGLSIQW